MDFLTKLSLTLSILISVVAAHPGPNLHHAADRVHQARQEGPAAFAGIEAPSNPASMASTTVPQTSRRTIQSSSSRPTGPTTYIPVGTSSIGPIPVTIVPVAIATICSPDVQSDLVVSNVSVVSRQSRLGSNSELKLPAAATAMLRLDSTELNNTSGPIPTFTAYNGVGCSTLYTRTSSAICSTVLSGVGSIPVSVTDCGQSITFSTSTGFGSVPTAAGSNNFTEKEESSGERLSYFIAPWYDLADGQVPGTVLVRNCVQEMNEQACDMATESWTVVNQTTSIDVMRSLAFDGPVTGVSVSRSP